MFPYKSYSLDEAENFSKNGPLLPPKYGYFAQNATEGVNKKVQLDATVCRHLFTAKSLYMFRVSQHPSSGALKTVTATSGIGHSTSTATSFKRGLIRSRWKEVAVPVL